MDVGYASALAQRALNRGLIRVLPCPRLVDRMVQCEKSQLVAHAEALRATHPSWQADTALSIELRYVHALASAYRELERMRASGQRGVPALVGFPKATGTDVATMARVLAEYGGKADEGLGG